MKIRVYISHKTKTMFVRTKIAIAKAKIVAKKVVKVSFLIVFGISCGVNYYEGKAFLEDFDSKGSKIAVEVAHAESGVSVSKLPEPKDCLEAVAQAGGSQLMARIAQAESGNNPLAENKTSTATGCFQILNKSWRYYGEMLWGDDRFNKNIYNPKDNTELAKFMIEKEGTSPWDSSKAVWSK